MTRRYFTKVDERQAGWIWRTVFTNWCLFPRRMETRPTSVCAVMVCSLFSFKLWLSHVSQSLHVADMSLVWKIHSTTLYTNFAQRDATCYSWSSQTLCAKTSLSISACSPFSLGIRANAFYKLGLKFLNSLEHKEGFWLIKNNSIQQSHSSIYPRDMELCPQKKICERIFRAVLFIIAKCGNNSNVLQEKNG